MSESQSCFGGASSQPTYLYTYNLWESSKYYNTNDLSPRNLIEKCKEEVATTTNSFWEKEESEEEKKDAKNRRIITKSSLYVDPDNRPAREPPPANDWTRKYWHRAGERPRDCKRPKQAMRLNHIQQTLNKAIAQPLKIEKAASMMAKMGWQGGALGKSGTGIVEPITPDAAYATTTLGFGHITKPASKPAANHPNTSQEPPKPPQKKQKVKPCDSEYFKTNVLMHVRDFVRNENEVEIVFETKLRDHERRRIHEIVNNIMYPDRLDCHGTPAQADLLRDISEHNSYVLLTQSEGQRPRDRALCIYKEAPEYMYLVTHHDLRDEPEETEEPQTELLPEEKKTHASDTDSLDGEVKAKENVEEKKEKPKQIKIIDKKTIKKALDEYSVRMNRSKAKLEEPDPPKKDLEVKKIKQKDSKFIKSPTLIDKEKNPFLKSILSVQKTIQGPITKLDLHNQVMEYFKEFCESDVYTIFKFLGPFKGVEVEVISEFHENLWMCLNEGDYLDDEMVNFLKEVRCQLGMRGDCNGSTVIYKIPNE